MHAHSLAPRARALTQPDKEDRAVTSVRAITEAFAVAEDAAAVSVASRALAFFLASDEAPTGDVSDRLVAARDKATARIRVPRRQGS